VNIFSFVGYSNSGKTRLIKRLVGNLSSRGYSVAVIKCCSGIFDLSPEGKDSQLFFAAGAEATAVLSADRWAIMSVNNSGMDIVGLVQKQFPEKGFILVEGGRQYSGTKKIGLLRKGVVEELSFPLEQLSAVIADIKCEIEKPVFHPDDIDKIIDFLIKETGK